MFFDQLVLRFTRGNLKEESHYYPHGLPIDCMGSTAHGFIENRRKYQSKEYIKDLGLNWMDFHARQYDPQLGRFLAVDPLADEGGQDVFSPYAAMGNAPESMVDPDGTFAFLAPEMVNTAMEVFGSSNVSVSGGGMVSFINLDAAILSFKAVVASGRLPSGAALSTSLYNALSSVLAFHNSSSVNARISLANNGEVETEWSLSLAETEINGDGAGNTIYSNGLTVHQQFAPANSGGCMTVPNEFVHATLETF